MAKDDPQRRWRDAALSGDAKKLSAMVQEMVAQDWPEYKGQVYVREYNRADGISEVQDFDAYRRFVTTLFDTRFASGRAKLDQSSRNGLTEQIKESYAAMQQKMSLHRSADSGSSSILGMADTAAFSYFSPGADGKSVQLRVFPIATAQISAAGCRHCQSTVDYWTQNPQACAPVDPAEVHRDRTQYFRTAAHEMAHAIRALNGDFERALSGSALLGRREEEAVAEVFGQLLAVKLLGADGVLQVRATPPYIRRKDGSDDPVGALYDRVALHPHVVEYIDANFKAIQQAMPRQLLEQANALVRTHDPVLRLEGEEALPYLSFAAYADKSPQAARERLAMLTVPGPNGQPVRELELRVRTQEPDEKEPSLKTMTLAYTPAMEQFDRAIVRQTELTPEFNRLRGKLNPLQPAGRPGSPEWQQGLVDFTRLFNHPSCDVPKLVEEALARRSPGAPPDKLKP